MSNRAKKNKPKFLKIDFTEGEPQAEHTKCDHDLNKFPWPQKSNSVESAVFIHRLEYIPGPDRLKFMEELYRILTPEGKATFITCYWTSPRSIQDFRYQWPPVVEQSYLYFNKAWAEVNKTPIGKCNFDFTYGYTVDQEIASKSQETQSFNIKHYLNSVSDLQVVLTKK